MDMDYDIDDAPRRASGAATSKPVNRKPAVVPVDDGHPFDLDAYLSGYAGKSAVDRALHVISVCPTVAPQAAKAAARAIRSTRDPNLFAALQTTYDLAQGTAASLRQNIPAFSEIVEGNQAWIDDITARNQSEKQKLDVELRNYANNMIKESIRMAHRDLGNFYRSTGDASTAMRHYTKSREYCTTSGHVLEMNFSCLELLIEQRNYAHIHTYVFKAESALDALSATVKPGPGAAGAGAAPPATGAAGGKKPGQAERELVQSKLDFASALSRLGQGFYEKAAGSFLSVGPSKSLGDWVGTLMSPSDIAIYGTLCALATFSRGAIKARLLNNDDFGVYIEQEPYVRDLVDAYMTSKFKVVLELLERFSTRHYADIHLASHVLDLTRLIRDRALVQYFQPFAAIRLERMSEAFGWTVEELEKSIVALIQSGEIKGRIDSQNKILKAKETDPRAELFAQATKAGAEMQSATRKLLIRLRLQQADLIVKAPKNQQQFQSESIMVD